MTLPTCTVVRETQTTGAAGGNGEAMRSCGRPLELLVSDFDRFYAVVHRYLLHRVFDIELAEDLTAETFYRAATRSRRFPESPRHARVAAENGHEPGQHALPKKASVSVPAGRSCEGTAYGW